MGHFFSWWLCVCSAVQSCLTLHNPMNCSPPVPWLLCPWDFPGKKNQMDCYFFLQGMFLWTSLLLSGKESPCQCRNIRDAGSNPRSGTCPREGKGNPLQSVFLPGKSHGQRSLVGYSPWSHRVDTTERAQTHTHTRTHTHKYIWKSEVKVLVAQLCLTFYNLMDCSPLGSSVHGISQARMLKWVAIHFSRGSSWTRDRTWVSCNAGGFFTVWATREDCIYTYI